MEGLQLRGFTIIIRKSQSQNINTDNCNCRNKHACPLQNKCMSKDIVYKATVNRNSTQDTKHYIDMTSNAFKERYRNHIKSFAHKKYLNELINKDEYLNELNNSESDIGIANLSGYSI